MSAHTPGPWHMDADNAGGGVNLRAVVKDNGVTIAWTTRVVSGGEVLVAEAQAEANARIIAAAPDLLEAAERVVARCPRECTPDSYCGQCSPLIVAITKARGGK